jgi:hypothetical protein
MRIEGFIVRETDGQTDRHTLSAPTTPDGVTSTMEIERNHRYPIPDRSNFAPNQHMRDPDLREGDTGASVDVLSDGRSVRTESWWQEGYAFITLFFSVLDLEQATADELLRLVTPLLAAEKVPPERRLLSPDSVKQIDDASGNRMFTLTFVVGEME